MSSGQGVNIKNRKFKYFKENKNKNIKVKRKGEGPLLKVHHLTII